MSYLEEEMTLNERKLSLLMDFYELTMANGYYMDHKADQIAVFDVFFRSIPDQGGYAVFAGLEQVIEYIKNLSFSDEEIAYLRSKDVFDASIYGARAAYISGAVRSSNTYVDYMYQIPAIGTMAHSYIQSYDSEYEAFKAYALTYPKNTVLLVDTYNTLKQGIPNAIKIHKEVLEPMGYRLKGIRLDSGDLTYLTKEARKMLNQNGLSDVKITVSNSLDEYLIKELIHQGAQIDAFGVGERLVTARSEAVFGGVFKLAAVEKDGNMVPKIKISENVQKTTTPGFKQVFRFYDENGMAEADVMTLFDEEIEPNKPYHLFDPNFPWKSKVIENFTAVPLLNPIFISGKLVYEVPTLENIRTYARQEHQKLWPEVIRLENPHEYYVDLSQKLWDLKQDMIKKHKK